MSESHSGGGATGIDSGSSDKEFSVPKCPSCGETYSETSDLTRHMRTCCPEELTPCPTCGKRYSSEAGVKQHHARSHNESLTRSTGECDYCGDEIVVHDFQAERQEHHFCDRDCSSSWQEDRVTLSCEICGSEFERVKSHADKAKYCSDKCRVEATRRITGAERYNYKTKEYSCRECGGSIMRSPSMVYSEDRVFCNDKCFDEFRRTGYDQYYGRNWNRQRRSALRRDQYRCQDCGITTADLPREPDVHHIQPIDYFKSKYPEPGWWNLANRTVNLVTLCPRCHRRWEGIPLKPQLLF